MRSRLPAAARAVLTLLIALFVCLGFGQTVTSIAVTPTSIVGGNLAVGTLHLSKAPASQGVNVTLTSSASFVTVPSTVYIAAGQKSGTFPVSTAAVSVTEKATITGSLNKATKSISVTVDAPTLQSLQLLPSTVAGGDSSVGTVALSGIAPTGGLTVTLKSSKPSAGVPTSVTVPAGQQEGAFSITTVGIAKSASVVVSAKFGAQTKTAPLTVQAATVADMIFNPATVVGGNPVELTINLNGSAPPGGLTVDISNSNPAISDGTTQITFEAGISSESFIVSTKPVAKNTSTVFSAAVNGVGVSASLAILATHLSSVTLNPNSVVGGGAAVGTVTLTGPAPSGGGTVTLSCNSSSVTIPSSVGFSAGDTFETFPIQTSAVSSLTIATITATIGADTTTATLTIAQTGALANSAWPKARGNLQNTALGIGSGAVGATKWSFTTGDIIGASSPSISSDGTLYVGSWDNNVYALNPDGSQKWSYQTGSSVFGSPTIGGDGTIYIASTDNFLYALTPAGGLKWKFQSGGFGNSSPTIGPDGTLFIGSYDNNLYALNPDGTVKWVTYIGNEADSSPALGPDGTIYIGSNDGVLYAITYSGSIKWAYFTGAVITSSPAIGADGTIYVGSQDSNVYAINPDGSFQWAFKTGAPVWASPAIGADGSIYIGSKDNNIYALHPDGTLNWKFATGAQIVNTSPAVGSDGTIYAGSRDNFLYALNPDGSMKWKFQTGSWIDSSPAIGADGTIYIGSNDHNLYAIK